MFEVIVAASAVLAGGSLFVIAWLFDKLVTEAMKNREATHEVEEPVNDNPKKRDFMRRGR